MHRQQRQRAAHLLDETGIELALFTDHDSVRWLTGLDLPAPALLFFERGSFTLLADEGFADASSLVLNPTVRTYPLSDIQSSSLLTPQVGLRRRCAGWLPMSTGCPARLA